MATVVTIPRFGNERAPALLAEWYQPDGASVGAGEIVFRVESDHIAFDAEAESAGVLRHRALVGESYAPGETVAYLLAIGERLRPEDEAMPAPIHGLHTLDEDGPIDQGPAHNAGGPVHGGASSASEEGRIPGGMIIRRRAEENISVLRRANGTMPLPPSSTDLEDVLAPFLLEPHPKQPPSQAPERETDGPGSANPAPVAASVLRLRTHVNLSETQKLRDQLAREWRVEDLSPSVDDVVVRAFARSLHERPELAIGPDFILRTIAIAGESIARVSNASTAPFHESVARRKQQHAKRPSPDRHPCVVSFAAAGIHDGDCGLSGAPIALAIGACFPWPTDSATVEFAPHVSLTLVFDPSLLPEPVAAGIFCRIRDLIEAPYALLAA